MGDLHAADNVAFKRLPLKKYFKLTIMRPDISYLILNYNPEGDIYARDVLKTAIESFYTRKSRNLKYDVYLLDQGSTQDHRLWLLDMQRRYDFSTIFLNRNIGISRAVNFFVRTCKAPVVALLTSDVIVTTGMDEDLFSKVQIQEVYQATPFTDKSDVDYQRWQPREEFGADYVDLTELKRKKTFWGRMFNQKSLGYLRCIGVEFNVIFWRKSIFEKVGYFDERWKAAYENNDFSLRCFLAGGCTALSYDSFVWHYHKVTEKNRSRERAYENYAVDWREKANRLWREKWPDLNSHIDIYKLLKEKDIKHFPMLYNRFRQNIYLPYDQEIDYD